MLLKLEGFYYATSIDLNMGHYQIPLNKKTSYLCKIILSRRKYWYRCLQMGVANSPEHFQQNMNDLFNVFTLICAYIDDILILTKG